MTWKANAQQECNEVAAHKHVYTHTHVYNEQTLRLKLKWPVRLFTKVSKKLCHRKNAAHLHLATVFSPQFPVPLSVSLAASRLSLLVLIFQHILLCSALGQGLGFSSCCLARTRPCSLSLAAVIYACCLRSLTFLAFAAYELNKRCRKMLWHACYALYTHIHTYTHFFYRHLHVTKT